MKSRIIGFTCFFIFVFISNAVFADITVSPIIISNVEYTDNIFFSEENEESDFITTVSFGVDAQYTERTGGIEIAYHPSYSIYGQFDENNTLRHDADLHIWKYIAENTQILFDNAFLLTEDPLSEDDLIRDDEIIIAGDDTARTSRNEYYSNTTIAQFVHTWDTENQLRTNFRYSFLENDDPEVEDNEEYRPEIDLVYWFSVFYGIHVNGAYTRGVYKEDSEFIGTPTDDFDNWFGSLILTRRYSRHFFLFLQYDHIYRNYDGDLDDDYEVYMPSMGFDWQIERDLHLRMGGGYFFQDVDDEEDEEGLLLNAIIDKTWRFRRGTIVLSGNTGIDQNDFGADNLGLEQYVSVGLDADYDFSMHFSGNLSADFRYSDVISGEEDGIEEGIIIADEEIEDETRYSLEAGLTYRPYTWMRFNLSYRYIHYDVNTDVELEDETITENRIIFGIELESDVPWRF